VHTLLNLLPETSWARDGLTICILNIYTRSTGVVKTVAKSRVFFIRIIIIVIFPFNFVTTTAGGPITRWCYCIVHGRVRNSDVIKCKYETCDDPKTGNKSKKQRNWAMEQYIIVNYFADNRCRRYRCLHLKEGLYESIPHTLINAI
jgi:hypothetical protein